ncbi:jg167 [Pararge aegeria aegeria]|uniref:Jg167 protein n=1 Tax=Pararge aegeria aegeria TaxID=348720 RepID=A0A8S4QJU9_9NEOP|nr:jg167 [Pararge aegeria aegeria]
MLMGALLSRQDCGALTQRAGVRRPGFRAAGGRRVHTAASAEVAHWRSLTLSVITLQFIVVTPSEQKS